MWLLNTSTWAREDVGSSKRRYAILSHTWGESETSFQDWPAIHEEASRFDPTDEGSEEKRQTRLSSNSLFLKPGTAKIIKMLDKARDWGIPYVWVDTCCIDKTSSAELSESINSMFQWYKDAEVCIVYLANFHPANSRDAINDMGGCRWFRRGWTLQELIAPSTVEFYDGDWKWIGSKESLLSRLCRITGIEHSVLRDSSVLPTIPVARRMSWAAERHTTREEDLAYSLLGIFDIHMPLIYGEGKKSFLRLQEAIARDNDDLTLFAWTSQEDQVEERQAYTGIFARSPVEFRHCGAIQRVSNPAIDTTAFDITNKGLKIEARLSHVENKVAGVRDSLLGLVCVDGSRRHADGTHSLVFVRLVKTTSGYARHDSNELVLIAPSEVGPSEKTSILIPKTISPAIARSIHQSRHYKIGLRCPPPAGWSSVTFQPVTKHLWDSANHQLIVDPNEGFTSMAWLSLVPEVDMSRIFQIRLYLGACWSDARDPNDTREFEPLLRFAEETPANPQLQHVLNQLDTHGMHYVLSRLNSSFLEPNKCQRKTSNGLLIGIRKLGGATRGQNAPCFELIVEASPGVADIKSSRSPPST